jgi:hypothetical protein
MSLHIPKCTNILYDYAIINTYMSLMCELKKTGEIFTSKFVATGPSSYLKRNLPGRGLTKVEKHCCRQYLRKIQVKLDTYHWGIQLNSVIVQIKKATFQRMGSGGKGRKENRWDVSGGQSAGSEV